MPRFGGTMRHCPMADDAAGMIDQTEAAATAAVMTARGRQIHPVAAAADDQTGTMEPVA